MTNGKQSIVILAPYLSTKKEKQCVRVEFPEKQTLRWKLAHRIKALLRATPMSRRERKQETIVELDGSANQDFIPSHMELWNSSGYSEMSQIRMKALSLYIPY